jgi:hypothetical protein
LLTEASKTLGLLNNNTDSVETALSQLKERLVTAEGYLLKLEPYFRTLPWPTERPLSELAITITTVRQVAGDFQQTLSKEQSSVKAFTEASNLKKQIETRLLGSNKTWKGLIGSLFFFSFWHGIFEILYNKFPSLQKLSLTDYQSISGWVLGLFVGFAASVSELPNSFIKRRCRVLPGKQTGCVGFFFDQADSVIGVTLVFYVTLTADLLQLLSFFLVGTFIHTFANILDSCVGLKRRAARSRSQLDKSSSQDELEGPYR